MKYISIYLVAALLFTFSMSAFAQDDELPPPSSKPKIEEPRADEKKPPNPNEFEGFKKKGKVDFSKFIIEPNFNLSIGQGMIIAGLSPYVGYKVWEPKSPRAKGVNNGLFVGGGITYTFSQINVQTDPSLGPVYYGKSREHLYGGGVFLQYNIWKGLFARTKFEVLHRSGDDRTQSRVNIISNPNGTYKMEFAKVNKTIPSLLLGVGYNLLQSKNFFMPIMVSYNVLHSITDKQYAIYRGGFVVQLGFINLF